MAGFEMRSMEIGQHESVLTLLREIDGIVLREADQAPSVKRYLERNPSTNFVASDGEDIVGCVFSGHDGRRGYLYHLAVAPTHRRQGIGRALVGRCLSALADAGIEKVHLDVLVGNSSAHTFWQHLGWDRRMEIVRYSYVPSGKVNV